MFKEFRRKWKAAFLVLILVFTFFSPFLPIHKEAQAIPTVITEDIPRKLEKVWDKMEEYILKALKTTVFSALLNVATITTQRLAYDAAMYVSGGGPGGDSLIEARGFKEYAQMLGEQAMGEFVGTLSQPWSKLGINLCEPSPLQKLEFQKTFTQNITVNKYQVASQTPAAPKCDWDTIKKSYTALGESLSDFSIDVDLKFDLNLQAGSTVNWDTNSLTGALKDVSEKFSSVTETLYNSNGIDLSKLWADANYLKKLFDDSAVPSDWKNISDVKKQIKVIREATYTIVNEKVKLLEKQTTGDSQSNLAKLLYDGELAFWQEVRNKVDLGSDKDAAYKEAFTNTSRLQALIKNKLIDRTVIMRLFSENKVTNDVLKYVYLDDLKSYVKKQGDDLSNFASFLQPGKNPSSVAMSLEQELANKTAEMSQKINELSNNQGFKNVTDIVSGRIKTPATVVQEQFKQQQIKDPSSAKWSSITGAYFNADVGTALLNVAMSTFTSTVFNNLMSKVYTGLFKPDQMINQNKVTSGLSQAELRKRYASTIDSEILSLDYQLSNYNLLDEFIICPEKYETTNNCVIDADWAQLLQGGDNMTIEDAINAGYLNPDWLLISENNPLNGDKYCYQKAYCYDNLQKLRRARILPVGFELAANLCEDSENSEYCSIQEPVSLGEVVDNFYNCGQDDDHPYSLWCNLIDPNWLLKAPAMKCRVQGYSEDVVSEELPQRKEVCVDDVSCIAEDDSGDCLGWGYCTKEKNVWRFSMANECSEIEDSCRSYTDSSGEEYSFLKNTLWLTDYNTCDSTNVGCAWYSRNKELNLLTGNWEWTDNKDTEDEALDRIYFNNKVATCTEADEGCSRVIRALPRLGSNLLPNSSFDEYTKYSDTLYSFDSWEASPDANLLVEGEDLLVEVLSSSPYRGLVMKDPIYINSKSTSRYFIYSAKLRIPVYLINRAEEDSYYNLDNEWSLTVDAYKSGSTSAQSSNIYDLLGKVSTDQNELEQSYLNNEEEDGYLELNLSLRFTTAADVDRLQLALVAMDGITNGEANQIVVEHLQLEEVSEYDLVASNYNEYNTNNLIYLKKAPDYYNCYQDWNSYLSEAQCAAANGQWDTEEAYCKPSFVCEKFAPYCSVDEVGCERFVNVLNDEEFTGIVEADDYCPEICAGYGRYYESATLFTDGSYYNFIPETASECNYEAVGCEEYTSVADDSGIEKKEYFSYDRICELEDSPDCQLFYTWDNPDAGGAKEISRYFLKAENNEPVLSSDDSLLCNEDIYNAGSNPACYKFYAVEGGEDIDLSSGASEYVSYHLINRTITCSGECKPYRLTREITEEQCLGDIENLNQFKVTGSKTLADGTVVDIGVCTVYTILGENNSCSAAYNGCREYRGSQSNSYFTLLGDSFEAGLDTNVWSGGIVVEDSVSYEGHSLNNLNSNAGRIDAQQDASLNEGSLYLLTFWARTSVASSSPLFIRMNASDEEFTGDNGLVLTSNWQKYTLGPVMAQSDTTEIDLTFRGIASGNLYIDSVELRELNDSYYYIAESWETPDVCDALPGTALTVPGYMLGCQEYTDSYGISHFLKSFTDSCRDSAVGCELVMDTGNNIEAEPLIYNDNIRRSIGDLVLPLISNETTCILGGYTWDKGRCYQSFEDAPIEEQQCNLWGYYWLNDNGVDKCFTESSSDDIYIDSDKMTALVVDEKYLCNSDKLGCSAFGKPSLDANGDIIECNYGETCTVSSGCTCRLAESDDYVCTVEAGQESCTMDTVYLLDNPLQYDNILCEANAAGCDEFVDSDNGIWYFRNPGNRLCEYQELRIDGQLKRGWFKKGTNEPCYENYRPAFGLWGYDHNLDYYVAGIDDIGNYDFYAATCSSEANKCTNFIDPIAMSSSGNRNYYYLWDDDLDTSSCNGQVNLAEGCVLFNNTAKGDLVYSAETSYANNLSNDYKNVTPYLGVDNNTFNPLTSYPNPYYLGDNITDNEVSVGGYVPLIDADGSIQYLEYNLLGLLEAPPASSSVIPGSHSVIGDILGGLEDIGSTGVIGAGASGSGVLDLGIETPGLGIDDFADIDFGIDDFKGIYFDILENNAKTITESQNYNNSNMVVKVERDRVCAEWLDSGDSQVVFSADGNAIEASTSLIACSDFINTSSKTQCVKPIISPPQKLDVTNYTLRGFGWDVLDYSGYSVPNMYALQNYKQIYSAETNETSLGVDMQTYCEDRTDCNSANPENYECVNNRCYNMQNGINTSTLTKGDSSLDQACRAYPREDSPLGYELGVNSSFNGGAANTCYPYVGQCVESFTGISTYEDCNSDLDCADSEKCIFTNRADNDDCLCDYQQVTYEDGSKTVYAGIDDESFMNQGLCVGGINDGLSCQSDTDCQSGNRTDFRVQKESTLNTFEGTCVFPQAVTNYYGLSGICLEKGQDGNCLTWYPVDRFIGQNDLYDQDPETAYPEDRKYYCLETATVIPTLRQGGHNVMGAVQCPENQFGVDLDDRVVSSDVAVGKMYYLVDHNKDGENCDSGEYRKQLLYNGAIVNVTQEKINAIATDWTTSLDNYSNESEIRTVQSTLEWLYKQIQKKWQGQSCLYMIADMYSMHPDYFYIADEPEDAYWDDSNVYIAKLGETASGAKDYPIVVTCRPDDMTGWYDNEDYRIELEDGSRGDYLNYYGIDPFMHTASGKIAKAVPVIIEEIKDIYSRYDNNCDIAFQTPGGKYHGEEGQISEKATREFIYLVNNVCEYKNVIKEDNINLYNSILGRRNDDNNTIYAERKSSALPEGEATVCNILAEVVDDEGNYKAYTNRLSEYSDYKSEIRDEAVLSVFDDDGKLWYENVDDYYSNYCANTDDAKLLNKLATWAAINPGKYYDLNSSSYPGPFGAVAGRSLYSPYQIPQGALPYLNQFYLNYLGVDTEHYRHDSSGDDFWCVPQLDPVAFRKNLLFDLFNEVYSIKSYKLDNTIKEGDRELAGIFAQKPYASYKDVDIEDKTDPFFAAYWKELSEFGSSASSYCKHVDDDGDGEVTDSDECKYIGPRGRNYTSFNDDSCILVPVGADEAADSTDTVNICALNEGQANSFVENWLNNNPFDVETYLADEYGMYYDEEEGVFKGAPQMYALPIDDDGNVIMKNLDGDLLTETNISDLLVEDCDTAISDNCYVDLDGDGDENMEYNYWLAKDFLYTKGAIQGLEAGQSMFDINYSGTLVTGADQGPVLNVRYLPIIFTNIQNIDVVAEYPGSDVSPLLYYYKETIKDNSLYELSFYAQAQRESLPIRRIRIDWGDGMVDDFQDYKFKNHLPICNPEGKSLNYSMEAETDSEGQISWEVVANYEYMTQQVGEGYSQGTAAAPENCVESPFIFKHWFTNVKGYNSNGDLMCNKGIPLRIDGTEAASPDAEDVVQCMLQGSVSITDNFGYERVHPMMLYVQLRPVFTAFSYYVPLLTDDGASTDSTSFWQPALIEPVEIQPNFFLYTPTEDEEENSGSGFVVEPMQFLWTP